MKLLLFILLLSFLLVTGQFEPDATCPAKTNMSIYKKFFTPEPDDGIPCSQSSLPSIDHLLRTVSALPLETNRKISAILGAVVADAASLPLQWIYQDMEEIGGWRLEGEGIVGVGSPAFYPARKCPLFTGGNSCYNDEMKLCLGALAKKDGRLDVETIKQEIKRHFGSVDSPYQKALSKRPELFAFDHWRSWQVSQNNALLPWINGCVIRSLQNMATGASKHSGDEACRDNDGFTLALPAFLLKYLDADVEKTAKILTTNPIALNHIKVQTKIIKNFIKNVRNPVKEALRWTRFEAQFNDHFPQIVREITHVQKALETGKSVVEAVETFGKACGHPGSFQGSLAFILNPEPFAQKFSYAVESNIIAGGDCCSRANFIGACFGAKFGIEGIPVEWIQRVEGIEEIIKTAIKVYANEPQKENVVVNLKRSNAF